MLPDDTWITRLGAWIYGVLVRLGVWGTGLQ